MGEKKTFTCLNISCKKTFSEPLKTLNLQEKPSETYFACPYCLSKIESPEMKNQEKTNHLSQTPQKPSEAESKNGSSKSNEKPATCQFQLGYLSERTQKEIPDNCLVCKNIVECMLRKVHGDDS
jgi:hypothetical protein